MRTSLSVLAVLMLVASYGGAQQEQPSIEVYKEATCGCCAKWVDHLRRNGFATTIKNVDDMDPVKARFGVPRQAESCHTAVVGGYVIEGHVPASDIKRLLAERPAVKGLAVPGMPIGSPGMEGVGAKPYNVFSFDAQGRPEVFSTQKP